MKSLTENQESVLHFIYRYVEAHGYAPSLRDIGASCGLSSLRGVTLQRDALVQQGLLMYNPRCSCAVSLTAQGKRLLGIVPELEGPFRYFVYDEERRCMVALEASNEHSNA